MQGRLSAQKELLTTIINAPADMETLDITLTEIPVEGEFSSDGLINALYKQIFNLRAAIDKAHHIYSHIMTTPVGKIWIRHVQTDNTSNVEFNQKNISAYNYLRIFYAYLLAAVAICRIHQFDHLHVIKAIYHIKKIISDLYYGMLESTDDDKMLSMLSEGKGYLILALHQFSNKLEKSSINTMLDQAKDWVALEEPSFPIMTIVKTDERLEKKNLVIIDEPCSLLTNEQISLFSDLDNKQWYGELSLFQQKLVLYYRQYILSGKCVIPSQLRAIVPLCKNTYRQTVLIQVGDKEFEEINSYIHTGTAAYVSHKDFDTATQLTRLNLLQLKMNSLADALVMICLNSGYGDYILGTYEWLMGHHFVADDSQIIKLTYQSANQLSDAHIYYSKICLNDFRMIEYNSYDGINHLINTMHENIKQLDAKLPKVIELVALLNTIGWLKWEYTIRDLHVKGLDIIHYLTRAVCLNNQLAQDDSQGRLKTLAVSFGCASGENRTGIAFYHNICMSIINYYQRYDQKNLDAELRKYIFNIIAYTQHTLVMTGNQGNTFGTEGIRNKSSNTLKTDHPKPQLITKSSDIKSLCAYDSDFNQMLDLLNQKMLSAAVNTKLKSVLYYANLISQEAEQQRQNVIFMHDAYRHLFTYILEAIFNLCKHPLNKQEIENFYKINDKFTAMLKDYPMPLPVYLCTLSGLMAKMIVEVNHLNLPTSVNTLMAQGLFKADVSVNTERVHSIKIDTVNQLER